MYVICIEDRFVHSIIVGNNGIVNCYETNEIDEALKIGHPAEAVLLKALLECINENISIKALEVK